MTKPSPARWEPTGRTLGEGGQGQVLVAGDRSGEYSGEFALKVLKDRRRVARLDLEISTMKSLVRAGANVIAIVDDYVTSEPEAERPWYVMPIADGGNPMRLSPGPFGGSDEEALRFFEEVVAAVRTLHEQGVAHRDLKPPNILRHEKKVLLCDLGLCLPLGDEINAARLTGELERIGSLHYIPKEAFGPRPLDRAQFAFDAYALGKILYELVAGRVLPGFTSPNEEGFDLYKVAETPLRAALNSLLRGLLSDDPSRRLRVLESLPERIGGLVEWARQSSESLHESSLEEDLSVASEVVARALAVVPGVPGQTDEADLNALVDPLMKRIEDSDVLREIRRSVATPLEGSLDLQSANRSNRLREFVSGAFVKTRFGLEPLEDLGYPTRSNLESGCGVGLVPVGDAQQLLPQLWFGVLVCTKNEKLYVAVAIASREPGPNAYADLVGSHHAVFKGQRDDPTVLTDALDAVSSLLPRFAEVVIKRLKEVKRPSVTN